jgi:hypothetical protein
MSTNYILMGLPTSHERELDDTDEHIIVAAVDDRQKARIIESILVTASAADTITISVKDGSGTVFQYAIGTDVDENNDYHKVNHLRILKPGQRITAEASVGVSWISITTVDNVIQKNTLPTMMPNA